MGGLLVLALALLVAALVTPSADAKGWPEWLSGGISEAPTFYIESIRVENLKRASPELIISESLLVEGASYDELELEQAVFRIQRLPFVLEARFALAKGSERGKYELVITVEEIRRYFFGEDAVVTRLTNSEAFETIFDKDIVVSPGPLAGIRFFVGRYGVVFGSVAGGRGVQAGYTHYNLFDRNIVFSLGLTANSCCEIQVFPLGIDPTFSSWQNEGDLRETRIQLGVPLRGNLGLSLELLEQYSGDGERKNLLGLDRPRGTLDYEDLHQRRVELALTFDNTDDPIFPSRGIDARLALDYLWLESDLAVAEPGLFDSNEILLPPGEDGLFPNARSRQVRLAFELAQHWHPWPRHTFSLSARLAVGRAEVEGFPILDVLDCPPGDSDCVGNVLRVVDEDLDLFEGYFTARHSVSLWDQRMTRERGDFRFETTLEFGYDRTSPDLGLQENPLYRKSATASLVFRNGWGLFRASFQIADYGRGF